MLTLVWTGLAAVVASLVFIVDAALPGGPHLSGDLYLLPFAPTFVAVAGAVFVINDRELSRLKLRRLWAALKVVPLPAAVGVLAALVAVLAQRLLRPGVVEIQGATSTSFDYGTLYLGAVAAALVYGQYRLKTSPDPPSFGRAHLVVYSICAVALVALGASSFVLPQPIGDDRVLHDDIASRFGTEAWEPHLVAVAFEHGAYVYHFDTRDEAVLSAACRSLVAYDEAASGQPTSLHYYSMRTDTFIRLCPSSS